ncbi:MAG: ribonuclease R, partial [Pacificimonas sp.]
MTDLPTPEQITEFVRTSDEAVGKREIAKAFGISGDDRRELRRLLRQMTAAGDIELGRGKKIHEGGGLPRVTVLTVTGVEDDQVFAAPENWEHDTPKPRVRVKEQRGRGKRPPALGEGDRVLARIEETGRGYTAHVMKRIGRAAEEMMGILRNDASGWFLQPTDKRIRKTFPVADTGGADDGELVLARVDGRKVSVA